MTNTLFFKYVNAIICLTNTTNTDKHTINFSVCQFALTGSGFQSKQTQQTQNILLIKK